MPVPMNKYVDPRDGSICVMPCNTETVETKHGVFKLAKADATNATVPTIVPASAGSEKTGVNVVAQGPKIIVPIKK